MHTPPHPPVSWYPHSTRFDSTRLVLARLRLARLDLLPRGTLTGSWQVCDATAEEIYDSGEDLWERLRASGRLTALCDDLDDDDY